jgi:L-ascorbate metabolism protein UlaG (beta-lactamase superfamily)
MKKHLGSLIIVLLFGLFILVSYIYIPQSARTLHEKVSRSSSLKLNSDRLNLVKEYGNYLAYNLPENNPALYFYWFSNQRKLSDLRVREAIKEIKDTKVESNKIRIWSLLNMGVVIKTGERTLAIDTANLPFSQAQNELASIVDIFVVSHMDGDHYDPALLQKASGQNKQIVFIDGFTFIDDRQGNIVKLNSGETKDVNGVKISAYQTDHRGDSNFNEPGAWFIIEVNGFKLLHTGDGRDFKNKNELKSVYAMKDFDILLGNFAIHPYNIRDLKPKVLIPLHLFKFMSGNNLYQESTIESVLKTYSQYSKDLQGIEKVYLLPGESFVYSL